MLNCVRVRISSGAPLNALVVKQADTLSSDGSTFGCMGSNPIESTRCRYRSMVRTSASQAGNTGSIPVICSILIFNDSVAQLVERRMLAYLRSLVRIQSESFKNRNRRSVAIPLKDSKSKLNKQRKALARRFSMLLRQVTINRRDTIPFRN